MPCTSKHLRPSLSAKPCKIFFFFFPFPLIRRLFSSLPSPSESQDNQSPIQHLDLHPVRRDPPISDELFILAPRSGSHKQGDSTFYSLIKNYANSGDFKSLEEVFDRMRREKRVFLEKSFILVFRAYGKARLPDKAIDLYERMVVEFQCRPTVRSFNSVLNVIIQSGEFNLALQFYSDIVVDRRVSVPNVLTFNLIVKAMCKLGMVDKAVDVFREMPEWECNPDVYTYCTLMDGLCKADRIEEAVSLLDEMQTEGCFPTPPTFNVLINGLCKKGDLVRAAKLVDNMFLKGGVPNEVTYNTLIHGLCLKGKLEKAISLLHRMVSSKHVPNDITYGTIIDGLVKKGRVADGAQILKAVEERGYEANEYVYSSLISGFFKERKPEEAMKIWKEMVEKGRRKPNTVVYSALIDGLCEEGRPDEAKEILFVPDTLQPFHSLRNLVWKQMMSTGWKPDVVSYTSMISGLCNSGSVEGGLKLFHEMSCGESGSRPDVITYNILFSALCKQDRISHAIDLLNTMLDQGCDPDSVTCNIFLKSLNGKLNPLESARVFLDELVVRLHKRQRVVGASNVIEVMLQKALYPNLSTLDKVVRELLKRKKVRVAIDKCWNDLFL
ncbi:unnamed protein product [Cuscuta campestris]|uniref:Pentacotripeptide-repeat region of PRORP domain-containing protein n=1 Tax=Cuscuta campestris TaxID=132261 RepID=A0A484KWL9_9ASTE|nr:unnamed protein product [Cuscuta campestris]